MNLLARHIVFSCCFLILGFCSYSQNIFVKASVDKNNILIGEPIQLTLEASVPMGMNATWFPLDSLAHFEFINKAKIDSVQNIDEKAFTQVLTITSFDSGYWHIPSLALEVNGKLYVTDSLPVTVAYSNFDASQDYHDIKDIYEVENADTKYINWIIGALALVSLLAVILFLRKKYADKREAPKKVFSHLSPVDEALEALKALQAEGLPEKGETKLYYTRMTDILRWFVYRKSNIGTMEKTSEELMMQLKQSGLSQDEFIALVQTLRLGDAVKFAKFVPDNLTNSESLRVIQTSVQSLNKLYQ